MDNYTPKRADQAQPSTQDMARKVLNGGVLSNSQSNFLDLYERGFNAFYVPYLSKIATYWQALQTTRLYHDASDPLNPNSALALFAGDHCNFAIMTGRTSGNLFVIDCETPQTFRYVSICLQERNIDLWQVRTRRGGHIYLRARREVENIAKMELYDPDMSRPYPLGNIEIRANNCYVIAPPSVVQYDDGYTHVYDYDQRDSLTPPVIDITKIDFLYSVGGMQKLAFTAGGKR